MIVDTMSLLEVAAELQSDLKNEVSVKMKRILADRKYWRTVLKYGNSKKQYISIPWKYGRSGLIDLWFFLSVMGKRF